MAYFKAKIRRCNYSINWQDEDTGEVFNTYVSLIGPAQNTINSINKMISIDKPNHQLTILMPKNPNTVKFFTRYAKFYLRKDYYDGTFPAGLNKYQNLEYGGFAFTGNLYVPMNEEIELCAPDLHVYDKYKDLFFENVKNHKAVYTSLTNNIHLRISLDEKTIWN